MPTMKIGESLEDVDGVGFSRLVSGSDTKKIPHAASPDKTDKAVAHLSPVPSTLRFAMDQSKRFSQSRASGRDTTNVMLQCFCVPPVALVLQPFCERLLPAGEIP